MSNGISVTGESVAQIVGSDKEDVPFRFGGSLDYGRGDCREAGFQESATGQFRRAHRAKYTRFSFLRRRWYCVERKLKPVGDRLAGQGPAPQSMEMPLQQREFCF